MLTQERLKELLNYDPETGVFVRKAKVNKHQTIGEEAGSLVRGYLRIGIDKKYYYAHRLAWLYTYGVMPSVEIDHINRIKTDNRIENLRVVVHIENMWNKGEYANNTSGYAGVTWHKQRSKWQARIRIKSRCISLGLFDTPEAANAAYIAAKEDLHKIGEEQ